MDIEEAIQHFEAQARCNYRPTREAAELAVAALRAQQTPLDRSRWDGCERCKIKHCWACKNSIYGENEPPCSTCDIGSNFDPIGFCPSCGKPLTEQAWAELEREYEGGLQKSN